ncbi:hypothetical protein Tco_0866688 [Tanacetum coccineum]
MAEEIALCQAWCGVSENSEKGNSMKAKGFWDAVIKYFKKETGSTRGYDSILSKCKNKRMGCDRSKAKKQSFASSREGSSSFVDLVADKLFNIKLTKWEKMNEQQDSYIQLKNQELDIHEAVRREAA